MLKINWFINSCNQLGNIRLFKMFNNTTQLPRVNYKKNQLTG